MNLEAIHARYEAPRLAQGRGARGMILLLALLGIHAVAAVAVFLVLWATGHVADATPVWFEALFFPLNAWQTADARAGAGPATWELLLVVFRAAVFALPALLATLRTPLDARLPLGRALVLHFLANAMAYASLRSLGWHTWHDPL